MINPSCSGTATSVVYWFLVDFGWGVQFSTLQGDTYSQVEFNPEFKKSLHYEKLVQERAHGSTENNETGVSSRILLFSF